MIGGRHEAICKEQKRLQGVKKAAAAAVTNAVVCPDQPNRCVKYGNWRRFIEKGTKRDRERESRKLAEQR